MKIRITKDVFSIYRNWTRSTLKVIELFFVKDRRRGRRGRRRRRREKEEEKNLNHLKFWEKSK